MNDYFLRVFVKERLLMEEVTANQSAIASGQFKTGGCKTFIQKLNAAFTGFTLLAAASESKQKAPLIKRSH